MAIDNAWVQTIALILGPSGVVWATVKATLNGAREDIRKTAATVERIDAKLNATAETAARLDERSEDHSRRLGRLEGA